MKNFFVFRKNKNMAIFSKTEDIRELACLADEIWHEYWNCILSPEQIDYMLQKFQSENAIKNQIKNDNYEYFFIRENEVNIGYFGVSGKSDYLFLSKIYVKKGFRNLGFGKSAFSYIIKHAEKSGYKRIILTVKKTNENSINAYKKWGFKIIDSVVTDIGMGFVMDDFIMEYEI